MSNTCEGFASLSNKEFVRFLRYPRKSCSEVQNCLYVALHQKHIDEEEFQDSYDHRRKVRRMIDGLIRYMKQS